MRKPHLLKFFLIGIFCLFSFSPFGAWAQDPSSFNKKFIDSLIVKELNEWNIVGASICIVKNGKVIYNEGHGLRNIQDSLEISPNTIFAMGSSAKAFTGAMIAQADTDSILNLDGSVYDQAQIDFGGSNLNKSINFKDLLTHSTGFPGHDFVWLTQPYSREDLIGKIKFLPKSAGLRERFQYNNIMFAVAGFAGAKIHGNSWETVITENIFEPLEMINTNFSIPGKTDEDYAISYHYNGSFHMPLPFRDLNVIAPAGGVYTNTSDLSKWLIMLLQEGVFKGNQVLDSMTIKKMFQPYVVSSFPRKFEEQFYENYGLGWMISAYRGKLHVHHAGNIDGFTSTVDLWPEQGLGIAILTNSSYANTFTDVVKNEIADYILELDDIEWNSRFKSAIAKSKNKNKEVSDVKIKGDERSINKDNISRFEGNFNHGAYGSITFTVEGEKVSGRHGEIPLTFEVIDGKSLREMTVLKGQEFVFSGYNEGAFENFLTTFPSSGVPIEFTRKDNK